MVLYISEAWNTYKAHFKLLVKISFVLAILGIINVIASVNGVGEVTGLVMSYASTIGTVYAYQKILGTYRDWQNAALQALWAWLAEIVIGAAFAIAIILLMMILLIPYVGWIIAPLGIIGLLIYLGKFLYIPYLAAKGHGFGEIIKKFFKTKLSVAWSAIFGATIVSIAIGVAVLAPLVPAIVAIVQQTTIWQTLIVPLVIIGISLAVIAYIILVPLIWMFPLVSGKDAVR